MTPRVTGHLRDPQDSAANSIGGAAALKLPSSSKLLHHGRREDERESVMLSWEHMTAARCVYVCSAGRYNAEYKHVTGVLPGEKASFD